METLRRDRILPGSEERAASNRSLAARLTLRRVRIKDRSNSARASAYHFTLLAQDETGYRNLVKLISTAHLDGFHYRPRIDKELLAQHSAGLIGLSGCLASEVNSAIQANKIDSREAERGRISRHSRRGKFLHRIARPRHRRTKWCNRVLPKIAKDLGVGLVAANDVHFLRRSDHDAHDVMLCIGTGKMVQDENRMRYQPELYFKSPAEMRELCSRIFRKRSQTRWRSASVAISRSSSANQNILNIRCRRAKRVKGILRELCDKGLQAALRRAGQSDQQLQQRLDYELGVLEKTGFVSYILIVWDFIHFAKGTGNPGRPRARLGGRFAGRLRVWESPTSIRCSSD